MTGYQVDLDLLIIGVSTFVWCVVKPTLYITSNPDRYVGEDVWRPGCRSGVIGFAGGWRSFWL